MKRILVDHHDNDYCMIITINDQNLSSGEMKSCAFVFVHTPHICMALTIVFHDKDHGDHDVYDHPANHDDCDSHDVLDHHGYHDDLEQYFSNIK